MNPVALGMTKLKTAMTTPLPSSSSSGTVTKPKAMVKMEWKHMMGSAIVVPNLTKQKIPKVMENMFNVAKRCKTYKT